MSEPIKWTNTTIKLSQLKPWEQNPRQSTPAQAKRILQSMSDFGQVQTVAISPDGEVYDGHQRLSALLAVYGADYELDARQSSRALTDYERRGLVLALHATAAGEWDWDELANWDLPSLLPDDFARDWLGQLNYDGAMVATMLGAELDALGEDTESDAEPQVSRADELQAEWGTELGQLWQIGEHRLLIGDCTVAENVERLMGGEKVGAILTDPPYGIGSLMHGGTWATKQDAQFSMMREWDNTTSQLFFDMIGLFGVPSVVWGGNYFLTPPSRCWLVWNKPEFPTMSSAELAWTNLDTNAKRIECNRTHQEDGAKEHATQKPIRVMQWSLEFLPSGLVLDPFLGSGTTMVAAQNLGRKCYGMEISPAYGAVILQRMIDAFPTLDIYQVE